MFDVRIDGTHLDASGHRLIVSNQSIDHQITREYLNGKYSSTLCFKLSMKNKLKKYYSLFGGGYIGGMAFKIGSYS